MSNGSETADTIHNAGKVHLADNLRLMADNQRTLDVVNEQDRRLRGLHARTEEAFAKSKAPGLADPQQPEKEEDMKILVDSPTTTTVNHHHPPPQPAGALAKVAVAAALLSGGLGMGIVAERVVSLFNRPPAPTPVVETPAEAGPEYEWRIKVE